MGSSIVVLSMHERGFWCADYYSDPPEDKADEWPVPDGFCTGKAGGTEDDIRGMAERNWPGVQIVMAVDDEDLDQPDEPDCGAG